MLQQILSTGEKHDDQLNELQGKAEDELEATRKAEAKEAQDFAMKKQSLEAEIKFATKDKEDSQKSMSANAEKKAANEGHNFMIRRHTSQNISLRFLIFSSITLHSMSELHVGLVLKDNRSPICFDQVFSGLGGHVHSRSLRRIQF